MSSIEETIKPADSADKTRLLFDRYFTKQISYPSNQVDAVVGFFRKRGFDELAATGVAGVLLQQAKIDNVNVFTLLDDLKGLDKIKLSNLVTAILNANRSKISKLGYRGEINLENLEARNIKI
jgi:hypothetical protein